MQQYVEHTGKFRVARTTEHGKEYLVLPVPGFPRPDIKPQWTNIIEASFGFKEVHAHDQRNLLWWDYEQKATITRQRRKS